MFDYILICFFLTGSSKEEEPKPVTENPKEEEPKPITEKPKED